MPDDASAFWENVKREIKLQNTTQEWVAKKSGLSFNTFQGWITKGIFPRANDANRIALSLNTSIESLLNPTTPGNRKKTALICENLTTIQENLDYIKEAVRELE